MPWKGEKDPYRIWLSEIILQQTRVEQGLKYYLRFITLFPTINELANTPEEELYKLWEGLGYYTRCKNLLETARKITRDFNGVFPDRYEEIRKLKGIGPYTAAAISSFAFNERTAVVDGNVQRVIARYYGKFTPVDTAYGKKIYQQLAHQLLDKENPGLYNQAIMDFGATICKPKKPLCLECVLQVECQAFLMNSVHKLPIKEKSLIKKNRWFYYFLIEMDNRVFIRKRTQNDIWQNLYEFVLLEHTEPIEGSFYSHPFLLNLLAEADYEISAVSKMYKQQLTHQNIQGKFISIKVNTGPLNLQVYNLVDKAKLRAHPFPKFINQFLDKQIHEMVEF
jgi:A/G-specific adenine glycosylase